jgi:hypothetical protein
VLSPTALRLDPAAFAPLAARAGVDPDTTAAFLAFLPRLSDRPALVVTAEHLIARLREAPRKEAMAEVAAAGIEPALGPDSGLFHLLLALLLLPSAEARHAARNVGEPVSRATFRDIGLWCRHFRGFGELGLSLETLDWTHHYLRGDLYRIGPLQLELRDFTGPLFAFRRRATGEIRALAEPGALFCRGGRSLATDMAPGDPGVLVAGGSMDGPAVTGHPISASGAVSPDRVSLPEDEWERVLAPGTPMLEMHIPADARVTVSTFRSALAEAYPFFARLRPEVKPRGIFGEAWLLDPQIPMLVPRLAGISAIQSICTLYPARIPEAKTIRRFFGPHATRAAVIGAPRDDMNLLQKALAGLLSNPENSLCSRGGFLLGDRIASFGVAGAADGPPE